MQSPAVPCLSVSLAIRVIFAIFLLAFALFLNAIEYLHLIQLFAALSLWSRYRECQVTSCNKISSLIAETLFQLWCDSSINLLQYRGLIVIAHGNYSPALTDSIVTLLLSSTWFSTNRLSIFKRSVDSKFFFILQLLIALLLWFHFNSTTCR